MVDVRLLITGATLLLSIAVPAGTSFWAHTAKQSINTATSSNHSLLLYSNVVLVPKEPIELPAEPNKYTGKLSDIPTVAVKFSTPVTLPKPVTPPSEVLAPVPASVAKRVAAYLFPVNQWDWVYLIAPRGLHGTAELGDDGSDCIVLQNQHALVELDTPGGSPLMASGLAAQFFPAAGEYQNSEDSGSHYNRNDLLHPATVHYKYQHRLSAFAFRSREGKSVYGYSFYTPSMKSAYIGAFGQSALFVYASDGTDSSLAKWVMESGLSSFVNVGEPELSGSPIQTVDTQVKVGTHSYQASVPKNFSTQGLAVATPDGIAWINNPLWIHTGPGMRPDIPTGPFSINLSPASAKSLGGKELAIIPSYKLPDASNQPWYTSVSLVGTAGPNWLLYETSYAARGMNQPAGNDLYAISLHSDAINPKQIHIASFFDAGGQFFAVGVYGSYVVYDQSDDLNSKGNMTHNLWLVNLANGKHHHLPSLSLKGSTVTVKVQGKLVRITLRQA